MVRFPGFLTVYTLIFLISAAMHSWMLRTHRLGQIVAMKIIMQETDPNELEIVTFLTSEEKSSDCHNHCVPILRILPVPNEEGHVIIVMPYLRPWYDPKFKTIGEGVQFFREMLEVG